MNIHTEVGLLLIATPFVLPPLFWLAFKIDSLVERLAERLELVEAYKLFLIFCVPPTIMGVVLVMVGLFGGQP